MYTFLKPLDKRQLALLSKKVLHRPQDCLLNLRNFLHDSMLSYDNDQRPRRWSAGDRHLLYPAVRGTVQLTLGRSMPQGRCLSQTRLRDVTASRPWPPCIPCQMLLRAGLCSVQAIFLTQNGLFIGMQVTRACLPCAIEFITY